MDKLTLTTPVFINGKKVKELLYDASAITVGMFAEAEARKLRKKKKKGGGFAGACEMDYSLHLYLGMMAIIAVNPEIDVTDLERVSGPDVMQLMRIGRNFITQRPEELSGESGLESSPETIPALSTSPSESSEKKS